MPIMRNIIARHNAKILKDNGKGDSTENERAAITTEDDNNSTFYIGLTSRKFKERLYEHTGDKNNIARRHRTNLSNHIWDLKEDNRSFNSTWSIMDRAPPFNPTNRKCRLCLKEKYYIMYTPMNATINKRYEFWTVPSSGGGGNGVTTPGPVLSGGPEK